jgi:hypothetical protein
MVELVVAKLLNVPFPRVISPTAKSVVASPDVNVSAMDPSLVVAPEDTVPDVMVMVGDVSSWVQVNVLDTILLKRRKTLKLIVCQLMDCHLESS